MYQDPKKLCYSPKQDPRIVRERDTIRLNLIEIFESWYDYRDAFSNFLSIYVHPRGQFIRNLYNEAGRFSSEKMFTHCSCCKYTEDEIPLNLRVKTEVESYSGQSDSNDDNRNENGNRDNDKMII